jgi:hypothetical protein
MASYAKQAQDETLMNMARRIQARAYERCGELLKQIEPDKGGRPANCPKCRINPERFQFCGYPPGVCPQKTQEGDLPSFTRTDAADAAGLSDHQRVTALRVANIPRDEFEELVESDDPPTATKRYCWPPWVPLAAEHAKPTSDYWAAVVAEASSSRIRMRRTVIGGFL